MFKIEKRTVIIDKEELIKELKELSKLFHRNGLIGMPLKKINSELKGKITEGEFLRLFDELSLPVHGKNFVIYFKDIDALNFVSTEEKPYLEATQKVYLYNPKYDSYKKCECGHEYHRHFDSYEQMENVGCKYCNCNHFKEAKK